MKRLRRSLTHLSIVHTASAAALLQVFGCITPNADGATGGTSSTSSTTATSSKSTATSSTTTSTSAVVDGSGGGGGAPPSPELFVERFEITNASTGMGGATQPDYATKIIAAAIQADGAVGAGCIDLRSVGFSGAGSTIVSESVVALLSDPLSASSHQAIETEICSHTPSGCAVTSTATLLTVAQLAIEQPLWGPDGFQNGSLYFPLDGHGPMPRMSNACTSGLYVDSWNHAANTPAAKAYLTAIGVDLASPNLQLQLDEIVGANYSYIFSFGMIQP